MAPRTSRPSAAYLAIVAFIVLYVLVDGWWSVPLWVAGVYLAASLLAFIAYAIDKARAVAGRYRVAENTLIFLGVISGWPGSIVAQQTLRHKTKKVSFRVAFWFSVVVNVGAFLFLTSPLLPQLLGDITSP